MSHWQHAPPPEVLLDILDYAGREPWGLFASDYTTVRACALVCRSWALPAQYVLFKTAVFDTSDGEGLPTRFAQFHKTLTELTARGSPLPNIVRAITVDVGSSCAPDREDDMTDDVVPHADTTTVARVVGLCRNLRSLQIFVMCDSVSFIRFEPGDFVHLKQAKLVNFVSIIGAVDDDVMLRQMLNVWPTVTNLAVEFRESFVLTRTQPPSLHLRTLHAMDEPPSDFIEHLTRSPNTQLDTVRLHAVTDLDLVIAPFARTVREVFLGCPSTDEAGRWLWPKAGALTECAKLEHFAVGAPPSEALLAALPPSVHTLGFSPNLCAAEDVEVIRAFVASRPRIRTVLVRLYRNSLHQYPEYIKLVEPLRTFCALRGIELREDESEYCLFIHMH